MSKPSEFYVGVLDFFAVLLPGAIATAVLAPMIGPRVLGPLVYVPTSEPAKWTAFLTCSYFVGHFLFLVGSKIDPVYEVIRKLFKPHRNESAFQCATQIRNSMLDDAEQKALNPFQWARSVLIVKCPAAAENVHRLEADSKFFRSMLIVCILSSIVFFERRNRHEGLVALLLVPLCFVRYYGRRLKSTTQAYIHVVTMHRLGTLSNPAMLAPDVENDKSEARKKGDKPKMPAIQIFEHDDFNAGHDVGDPGWEIQTDQDCDYIGDDKNDQASSAIVNSGTWDLFADTGYAGKSIRLGPGSYSSLDAAGLCNDCLSSFKQIG